MTKIHYLDENLKNMIAAGEVVERPSGIIKELVDNSIDASATRIEVRIEDGGLKSLEVIDNGSGMDYEDALMCFKRHATSKIKKEEDLWKIHTLGFRGEALPSIASVAHVELKTSDGATQTEVIMDYGNLLSHGVCACNKGTSIKVSGLFYKTPARLKHLKNNHYEQSLIVDVVYKFALAHPEISFVLISNGKTLLETLGDSNIKNTVYAVYGREIARNSFEIKGEDIDYKIEGIGILPTHSRANKNYINIYVNSRMVKSYGIQKNIVEAYHRYMPDNRYPIVVLNIKMDNRLVDVNVHPAKWEIRLSKQKQLEGLVFRVVEESLNRNLNTHHVTEKDIERKIVEKPKIRERASQEYFQNSQLFTANKTVSDDNYYYNDSTIRYESKVKEEPIVEEVIKPEISDPVQPEIIKHDDLIYNLRIIGSMHGAFILCENEDGLYIVDQHAAEERYHYEMFMKQMFTNKNSIDLLFPVEIEDSNRLTDRIDEINREVSKIGIEYEVFGNKIIVRSVPLWMETIDDAQKVLEDVLDLYEDSSFILNELSKDKIASKACKASVKFNHQLTPAEMKQLLVNLSTCENPYNCPHGRPTIINFDNKDLERMFKR